MSQLIFPLLLLLIILKSSRQNEGQTVEEKTEDESQTDRTAIYRERHRQRQQRERGDGGGRGMPTKSRSRYLEFAETEFSRPSSYLSLPFVAPANNQLQAIPARTLSQLIRQHIARNRMKQLASQNPLVDNFQSNQSLVKEFRQTPFRRWPSNSTVLTYAEKRRQWKTEFKRRLKEQKVRTRVIPPLLISGGGFSSIITDREPENRYYVTYSPQTRTYQVSRHPPPHLYITGQDTLPQPLEEEPPQQVLTEGQNQQKEEEEEKQAVAEPSAAVPTSLTAEESTTTSAVRRPSLLIILQNAEVMPNGQSHREQSQRVEAIKTEQKQTLKQILFLDDYEQVQGGDEEGGNEMGDNANGSKKDGGSEQQQDEEEDEFVEEENEEDEEMFFFKPTGGRSNERRAEGAQNDREIDKDPFRILVHETSKKL